MTLAFTIIKFRTALINDSGFATDAVINYSGTLAAVYVLKILKMF